MKSPFILATAVASLFAAGNVTAAPIYWDATGTGWDSVSSWSTDSANPNVDPGAVPGAGDTAIFNISSENTDQIVNLNADQAALGLVVDSTGLVTI